MLANTWDRPVTITAELGNVPLDVSRSIYTAETKGGKTTYTPVTGPLPPGQVALVFLSEGPVLDRIEWTRCPTEVTPAYDKDPGLEGIGRLRGFHLVTDAPVSAYSIYPYGGARSYIPSATLLLPVSSWTTSYVTVSAGPIMAPLGGAEPAPGSPSMQVIAQEDGTTISMRPTVDIDDGPGVEGTSAFYPKTWTLSRGEVLQITQGADLSGTALVASKPIGLFGGNTCPYVPYMAQACDSLHQQIAPLAQWGTEYALVPYRPRLIDDDLEAREKVPYRFVGAVDGTVLTYEPERPIDAPSTLDAGQVAYFMTDQLLTVKSQGKTHPFYANVYMTSCTYNGQVETTGQSPGIPMGAATTGDPDFVNIVPSDQFLDRYVLFADYTYPETTLTFVRKRTKKGFMPVELECAGEVPDFRPLGSSGEYEFAWMRLTRGTEPMSFAKGTCGYGRHEAKSDGPFSVTVWGTGYAASYGYAGGTGLRPLNEVEVAVPR